MASILTVLFYMAVISALGSLIMPAQFYEMRKKSRKQYFLRCLVLALLFFIGISFFAPSVPIQRTEPTIKASQAPAPPDSDSKAPAAAPETSAPASETPTLAPEASSTPESSPEATAGEKREETNKTD